MESTDEQEAEPNYKSISFILQNLSIASMAKLPMKRRTLDSRKTVAQSVVYQIIFYIYCILKCFTDEKSQNKPVIVILGGSGFIAQRIIYALTDYGLKPFIKIYSRGNFKIFM